MTVVQATVGVWAAMEAGLASLLRRQAGPKVHPRIHYRAAVLGVLDTERQVKEARVLLWSLVWPTAFQEHTGWGPRLGQRGKTGTD